MNAATRKKLLAYAIPVDLVVVATGIGLLVPGIPSIAIIWLYVIAVAVSAWKSGWPGAIAAIVLSSALLFLVFRTSVPRDQIGVLIAGGVAASIPLAALHARRARIKALRAADALLFAEPIIAGPQSIEEAAAEAIVDPRYVAEREARAGAEGERIAAQKFAAEKTKIDAEYAARLKARQAELQAAYDNERAALKAEFDAARLELEAERTELKQRPPVIEKHIDEEVLAQRLEHLRAELQQQFEREMQPRIDAALARQREALARDSDREMEKVRAAADERVAALRAELDRGLAQQAPAPPAAAPRPRQPAPPQRGIFSRFFHPRSNPQLKLNRSTVSGENTANRRAAAAAVAENSATRRARAIRKPRVLFLESRRASADTAAPRLKQLGLEVVIVERLADAVDEVDRVRPDILFLDTELPDFEKAYQTFAELPIVLTARNASSIPNILRTGIAVRPYAIDDVVELARGVMSKPADAAPKKYDVSCVNCRVVFDAAEADWCSCLTRDRTVVCTNCLTCFCNAAPAYKEIFWSSAPPRLLERKAAELRRQSLTMSANVAPSDVRRPLVMLVDSDPDNQAIMQRVCANLGYGAVSSNGEDALAIARAYRPNLVLADAILPRLDGRELCRLLQEDPGLGATKFVLMSGLYTDTKFKTELVQRFGIDDCVAKPVSITDVINLLQRHLEGVRDLPAQENLYDVHRKAIGAPADARTTYEIACVNCGDMFDGVKAKWCACTDGDHTLACEHCGGCFCDAADYRKRFWAGAPAALFERKTIVDPRNATDPADSKRPLLALIEDDESVQLLVRTIASTLGYGFAGYADANEEITQKPDLIFVDALLSRHDNRGLARRLKDVASIKVVVMSGRATDPEFRHDAAARFKVDDCLAKPLAAADVIAMLKKYLPHAGTTG
ncbi:MAG: Phosphate regulon transcriptional regulatory protein PhoB [Acidobacteria bacterium]|nr:Phosphate regulon transcriptional regulatory protein PhoB [Acidobacteriota bacterium]